ncbi:MAG: hypothetical protein IT458_19205 [Planctomycetes bacterium]|nr:hypothetical protein [Planctomycetota bacterium]
MDPKPLPHVGASPSVPPRARVPAPLRLAGLLGLLFLAGWVGAEQGRDVQDVIRSRRFELLDGDGKVRARLGPGERGETELVVLDPTGRVRTRMGLNAQQESVLSLHDAEGKTRLALVIDEGSSTQLLLLDPGQKPRLHLAVSQRGAPGILFVHSDGTMPAGLGVHADGRAWALPAKDVSESQPTGR